MKIVVLAPSADYAGNAGARIRYARIAGHLAAQNVQLSIEDIGQFDADSASCDVVIVSKCYDARGILAAEVLAARGVAVGIDMFDDYFSQAADSRLIQKRAWLAQISSLCDFALCSTPITASVIADYAPSLPVHVLNDPAPDIDWDGLKQALNAKLGEVRSSGVIRVAWFGIGDNPHFPVGLSDLAAFAGALGELEQDGKAVELNILTNERALDSTRLAMIARLPVATTVGLWSEKAEAELLDRAFLCVLPVSAQPFSIAKSLNRAITALSSGCQLLSLGFPLYAELDGLLYRNAGEVLEDLGRGRMRFSGATIGVFDAKIEELASPAKEASRLVRFLEDVVGNERERPSRRPIYLVHGIATTRAAHLMARKAGGLSVRTPFCDAPLDFDVLFEAGHDLQLTMLVSQAVARRLSAATRRRAVIQRIAGRKYWRIGETAAGESAGQAVMSLPLQLASYPMILRLVADALNAVFGAGRTIISENSTLPFDARA